MGKMMLKFQALQEHRRVPTISFVRLFECAMLATLLMLLSSTGYGQSEADKVDFNIPAQALPTALNEFSRQAQVPLVFGESGFDGVQTNALVGSFERHRALQLLLVGTNLQVSIESDDTVIVERASETSGVPAGSAIANNSTLLLAQADGSSSQSIDRDSDSITGPQDQMIPTTSSNNDQEAALPLEEVIVTGSRIPGAQSASPLITISRQDIDRAGFATVEELIEKLPQNFGAGASLDNKTDFANTSNVVGGNVEDIAGGTSINLRGLGASSTLILLNGRRLSPSGFSARFTNVSSIPVTAIKRVEVLTDGASAIYGSDAIGGVVNFILREDYDGAESRLRYGSDSRGDTSSVLFGQTFGKSWDDGNVLLSYEYYDSGNLANSDRAMTASNDLRPFGGIDHRAPGGNPANIDAGGQLWAIPAGQDGTALTSADFDPNAPPNLYNSRSLGDVLPELERHSVFLNLTQAIGPVELFAQSLFSTQDTLTRANPDTRSFDVPGGPTGNPFFVDPTGTGLTTVQVDNYSFENDFVRTEFGEIDSLGASLGVRFDIGENWHGELAANWSKEEGANGFSNQVDQASLDAALIQTDPGLAFNPFGDGPNTNFAVLESIVDRSRHVEFETENEVQGLSLNVDGTIIEMPGGAVRVAAGTEFREESILTLNTRTAQTLTSDLSRDVFAVYTELFFPLVGGPNRRPGMQRLEISVAARYEDYNDFGDTTNPKVGIVWSPTQSLTLRGTYGTSFRAPSLFNLDVSNQTTNASFYIPQLLVGFGIAPFPLIGRVGGNENLQAEEATTWTAGFQWRPEGVEGLSVDMTYFNVDFEGRIDLPIVDFGQADDPRFRTLLSSPPEGDNQAPEWLAQVAAIVNDSRYLDLGFGVTVDDLLSGAAPVDGIFDARIANLSQSVVTGVDLQLAYGFETTLGSFDLGLSGNYMFDFERAFIEADPLVDEVDTYGRPVDFQMRGNVTWSRNAWSATGYINYTDGYTDNISDPARPVDSWTTVDLSIVYDTGDNRGFFSDTRLSLTTQNLFDEDPPFVDTFAGLGYDSVNGNPMGRSLALQIAKEW